MFTPPTRVAGVAASTIPEFGQALAGRGPDINSAIGAFVPLLTDLAPVARNLAAKRTDLGGFFHGLERYSAALVPVAQTQAALFGNLATTFRALASVAVPSLQETISRTYRRTSRRRSAEQPGDPPLPARHGLAAARLPAPARRSLPQSAPVLASAFKIGTRTLPPTAGLDERTVALSKSVAKYSATPGVQQGLDRLTLTASKLQSPLAFLTPVQASCNYVTLFLRNISSVLSEHVSQGGLLRFVQIAIADLPGAESQPSQKVYPGPGQLGLWAAARQPVPVHGLSRPAGRQVRQPATLEHYLTSRPVLGNPPANKIRLVKTETTKKSGGS